MKLIPIVVMARKSSFSRRLGRPRTRPMNPVMKRTSGRAPQKEKPPAVVRRADA